MNGLIPGYNLTPSRDRLPFDSSTMLRPSSRIWLLFVCLVLLALGGGHPLADDAPVAATHGDAYIKHEPNAETWSIGNATIELVVGFNASKTLVISALSNPSSGSALDIAQPADTSVTIGGDTLPLNESNDKMTLLSAAADETDAGVRLVFTFRHRVLGTLIQRGFACYPGSPTLEVWTRLDAPAGSPPVQISNLVGWQLNIPNAPVQWIDGLRGENAADSAPHNDTFALDGGDLDDGVETDIWADGRSSETFVPLITSNDGTKTFYGGVIWSGAWRITMLRQGDRVTVGTDFPKLVTTLSPDRPIEFPHTFLGYVEDGTSSGQEALQRFLIAGVRRGRPFRPLVTYNTWYPYGATLTEDDVYAEMAYAASVGVELFVVDAGWWMGAGELGDQDFTTGLGSWTVDPNRFPAQLVGMADQAHALGMKFGLWVEPERVALGIIGKPGLADERWLAMSGGSYGLDGQSAQLCLASAAARKWVLSELVGLIDQAQPDYIKWDNNFWINCDRGGHGHGTGDGNYSHVMGLYTVLDEIRQRYPDLLIENVSGGGNRLDYGMAAYTDVGWMDDLSAPSEHVRHNIEGLSLAFPPAYLLSFVIDGGDETITGGDLPFIARSRMPAALGVTYRYSDLDPDTTLALATQIAQYKTFRDTVARSAGLLLTTQVPVEEDGWDVIQEVTDDRRNALVFGFKSDAEAGSIVVHLHSLAPDAVYDVRSLDNGELGTATGSEIMRDGVQLNHSGDGSRAHLLLLSAQ